MLQQLLSLYIQQKQRSQSLGETTLPIRTRQSLPNPTCSPNITAALTMATNLPGIFSGLDVILTFHQSPTIHCSGQNDHYERIQNTTPAHTHYNVAIVDHKCDVTKGREVFMTHRSYQRVEFNFET